MTKRILSFICACSMASAMTACGSQGSVPDPGTTAPTTVPALSQEIGKEVQQMKPLQSVSGENASVMEETGKEEGSDILVVYFPVAGTTKTLARYISEVTGRDLYEAIPEILYSPEDLNYSDNDSRSTREQNDEGARPVISGSMENMDQYETILLGYLIWWGEVPCIIGTSMESYDFSGKTIVPLCTSEGSGIGSSARNLHDFAASDVAWLGGERLNSDISHGGMVSWINGLSLDRIVR